MPTHGSLTKAGKVRAQTPKIEGTYKRSPTPRKRNISNYKARIANVRETRFGERRQRSSF
ncbi:30S ribosomal protein S30e [Candidatus Bathyarchaeota archaeon]|nr:30S ribosomal protein S30e [Candidatus Bathyarchaeota archaeon]